MASEARRAREIHEAWEWRDQHERELQCVRKRQEEASQGDAVKKLRGLSGFGVSGSGATNKSASNICRPHGHN